jgi:hypothetical protein
MTCHLRGAPPRCGDGSCCRRGVCASVGSMAFSRKAGTMGGKQRGSPHNPS